MHWSRKLLLLQLSLGLLPLLLLLLLSPGSSPRRSASTLSLGLLTAERFRSLSPEILLSHYRATKDAGACGCDADLRVYLKAIDRQEPWALKMLDASSRMPSSVLAGNIVELGAYDECVGVRGSYAGSEIKGQHCMYQVLSIRDKSIIPYQSKLSICLPRSCGPEDLAWLVRISFNASGAMDDLLPVSASCTDEESTFWEPGFLATTCILSVYVGFLIACTICDIRISSTTQERGTAETNLLVRFSLLKSSKAILNMKAQPGNMPVIHGIRFISTLSIIFLHETCFHVISVSSNAFNLYEWMASWGNTVAMLDTYSVDTFFALSGFLMTGSFIKHIQKGNVSFFRFWWHRYIRLTAPMTPIIFISMGVVSKLASGPQWQWAVNSFIMSCRSKWWSILLHVKNFVEMENHCLPHLWTIGVDMQLYTISLLFFYILSKNQKIGMAILVSLISIPMIITAFIVGVNGYYAMYISQETNSIFFEETYNNVYFKTYTRASPFFIGISLGLIVYYQNFKLSKFDIRMGWLMTSASFLIHLVTVRIQMGANYKYTLAFEMLTSAFSRPLWSLMVCWIIYLSIHDAAGPVAKFLSWKYFLPLSRLSYSMYLIHMTYPLFRMMTLRNPSYISTLFIVHAFVSNLVISIVHAFVHSIIFELPIFVLEDLIFNRKNKSLSKILRPNGLKSDKEIN